MTPERPTDEGKKGTVPICRNGPEGASHKWGLSPFSPDDSLRTLLDAACSDVLTDEQFEHLEASLSASEDARREYLRYFTLTGELRYLLSMAQADAAARERTGMEYAAGDHLADKPCIPSRETLPGVPFPAWIFRGMADGLSREWTRAYLSAAVILGLFLLVASFIYIPHTAPIDRAGQLAENKAAPPTVEFVGRITGMVDVKWSDDPRYLPPLGYAHVSLGRKYILSSGLLEITYDSGAKVILEGPCTYEVESTAGGYLALGKLTAKVEKERSEVRGQRSDHYPLSTTHYPLFSVRTPTAIVTDLGTEFGVEVNDRGQTKTQVFVGKVRLASIVPSGKANEGRVLSAGQTGVVRSDNTAIVVADAAGATLFVRVMPPPKRVCRGDDYAALVLSLRPVVYYRMERPEKMEEDRLVLFDSSPGDRHGVLHWNYNYGRPWLWGQRGRFDGALYLRGPDCHDYAIVSELPDGKTNQLSFSAWVRAEAGTTDLYGRIACEGDWRDPDRACRFTIGLQGPDGDLEALLDQADGKRIQVREGRSTPFPMGQWQHVALVADESALRLYRNGVEVGSSPSNGVVAALDGDYLTIGCASVWRKERGFRPSAFWGGWIDELAVFRRALRREEIRWLFEGLVVPGKEGTPMNGP